MKNKSLSIGVLIFTFFLFSSLGKKSSNPPYDYCGMRQITLILSSQTYTPNPAISWVNTAPCLPVTGNWRDNSVFTGVGEWFSTPSHINVAYVRVESVGSPTCAGLGHYWYNGSVQISPSGLCSITIWVFKHGETEITVNGFSTCSLPGLPEFPGVTAGSIPRKHRVHYYSNDGRPYKFSGGITTTVLGLRMFVNPRSFELGNNTTKC